MRARAAVICPKCRRKMREQGRSFHKKRKWRCPRCGRTRWSPGVYQRGRKAAGERLG